MFFRSYLSEITHLWSRLAPYRSPQATNTQDGSCPVNQACLLNPAWIGKSYTRSPPTPLVSLFIDGETSPPQFHHSNEEIKQTQEAVGRINTGWYSPLYGHITFSLIPSIVIYSRWKPDLPPVLSEGLRLTAFCSRAGCEIVFDVYAMRQNVWGKCGY